MGTVIPVIKTNRQKRRGWVFIAEDTELKGSGFETRTCCHLWLARGMLWSLVNPSWVGDPRPGWGAMRGEAQYHGYTYSLTNKQKKISEDRQFFSLTGRKRFQSKQAHSAIKSRLRNGHKKVLSNASSFPFVIGKFYAGEWKYCFPSFCAVFLPLFVILMVC